MKHISSDTPYIYHRPTVLFLMHDQCQLNVEPISQNQKVRLYFMSKMEKVEHTTSKPQPLRLTLHNAESNLIYYHNDGSRVALQTVSCSSFEAQYRSHFTIRKGFSY